MPQQGTLGALEVALDEPTLARIEQAGLLFVHIPKAAGMSISDALYGDQVKHVSIRLLHHLDGGRLAGLLSFAVMRDPIACKPAVMAETDRYVAFGSEYRALVDLPGIEAAHVFEPEPARVYAWERN